MERNVDPLCRDGPPTMPADGHFNSCPTRVQNSTVGAHTKMHILLEAMTESVDGLKSLLDILPLCKTTI
jgi:hypothetical protein